MLPGASRWHLAAGKLGPSLPTHGAGLQACGTASQSRPPASLLVKS